MPRRRTKRGAERTPLGERDVDVLICGASFAGLAVARELTGSGARVLMIDRYEIGERQTSACGIPTGWLENLGLMEAERQRFDSLLFHTPHTDVRYKIPWKLSTFDYPQLCRLFDDQNDADFETAKVNGRTGDVVHTDRGDIRAPMIVDCMGWKRMLGTHVQPPDAPLSRGLEVHPHGQRDDLEFWIDRKYVPAGYGWSFPARDEVRVGIGSYDPRFHVKDTTVLLAEDEGHDAVRYQGNWIPHKLRDGTEDGVFFAGDSAGHCIPTTAEGIRTAFYFGIAVGREMRAVLDGRKTRAEALVAYHDFNAGHEWKFNWMLRLQRAVPATHPRLLAPALNAMASKKFVDWAFAHYLNIAPPSFVEPVPSPRRTRPADERSLAPAA